MIIHYYSGATLPSHAAKSVHIMKMCEAWGKAGHTVILFAKGRAQNNLFQRYGVESCFTIRLSPNVPMPIISGLCRLVWNWGQAIKEPASDLAYGRDPLALLVQPHTSARRVLELHQMPYISVHKIIFGGFKRLVVISQGLKDDVLAKYTARKKHNILVAHDGASMPPQADQDISIQNDTPGKNIGYAGSLQDGKGIQTILALAEKHPELAFHVIGGSQNKVSELQAEAKKDNLVFYGHIDHALIPSYLKKFDILLAPYAANATIQTGRNIARWISPLKLFEYMAVQKPILCSNLPVIQEVLKHGRNAILVEPDNLDKWSEALISLSQNPEKSGVIAAQAYEDFKSHYTWEKRAEAILHFCAASEESA